MADFFKADSGISLQVLTGQHNYNQWARDFKIVATSKGVFGLYTGDTKILKKPVKQEYLSPGGTGPATRKNTDDFDFSAAVAEYRLDLDEYKDNEKLVREAHSLLAAWVDPAIRGNAMACTDPKSAWDFIKSQYKMTDKRALDLARSNMDATKLSDFNTVTQYLNAIQCFKLDIKDAGGEFDDDAIVSKIIRGLPTRYDTFVDQHYQLVDTDGLDDGGLRGITARLLTFEGRLKQRKDQKDQKELKDKKEQKDKYGQNKNATEYVAHEGDSRKHRDKCINCGKWGHKVDTCWLAHPELKSDKAKFSNDAPAIKTEETKAIIKKFSAMASVNDLDEFKRLLAVSDVRTSLGTIPTSSPGVNPADRPPQYEDSHTEGSMNGGYNAGEGGMVLDRDNEPQAGGRVDSVPLSNRSLVSSRVLNLLVSNLSETHRDAWIADTGANAHIVNDAKWFTQLVPLQMEIGTADNEGKLLILGGGHVEISLRNEDGDEIELRLSEAAFAPASTCNLLSLSALYEKSKFKGRWGKTITIESSDGDSIGEATLKDGLYHLNLASIPARTGAKPLNTKVANLIDFNHPAWRWHRRLGHLSFEGIRKLAKQSEGIDLTDKQLRLFVKSVCPICATTRAINKIPRDPANRRFKIVGELIHVDTWGPYPIRGYDGSSFFLLFTDDATRYTWGEPFTDKSDIPELFRKIHKRIEKTYNSEIRRYRFDNEFNNPAITDWLDKHGVSREVTAPYAHNQNGVEERSHRTERERASAMLAEHRITGQIKKIIEGRGLEMLRECNLPESLWVEAWKHAIHIKNRSPTKAHKFKKTPWEALTGYKPNLSGERIWGSRSWVKIPPDSHKARLNTKLHGDRGWVGYFMGCEGESIKRIYSPDESKVLRISVARIEDGEGLDDDVEGPSLRDRDPPPSNIDSSENQDTTSGEDTAGDTSTREVTDAEPEDYQLPNNEGSQEGEPHNAETFPPLSSPDEGALPDGPSDNAQALDNESDTSDEPDDVPVVSKFFQNKTARMGFKRKRQRLDEDLNGSETESEDVTSDYSDSEFNADNEDTLINGIKKGRSIGYQNAVTEDTCDHCAKFELRCDDHRPCEGCSRNGRKCIDQRPSTKNLVRKEKRHGRHKAIELDPGSKSAKCRRCYAQGTRCIFQPKAGKCDYCIKIGRTCTMDLTGVTRTGIVRSKEQWARKRKGRPKGIPFEQKCYRCFAYKGMCDGNKPCSRCLEGKHKCISQADQKLHKLDTPKCTFCQSQKTSCDKKRPCGACVKKGRTTCSYYDQGGLLTRMYIVDPEKAGKQSVNDLSESDDECKKCILLKRNCDGEKPCLPCISDKSVVSCVYHCTGRSKEAYSVAPYTTDDEGRAILNPDYEGDRTKWDPHQRRLSGMKKREKMSQRRAHTRKETQTNQDVTPTAQSSMAYTNAAVAYTSAQEAYDATFPNGIELIDTDGSYLLCGLRAVIETMAAMHPHLPRPTTDDLLEILNSEEFQQHQSDFNLDNSNNFFIDQVGAILQFWANTYHDLALQVGSIIEGQPPMLVPFEGPEIPLIIWIHNAPVRTSSSKMVGDLRHFSGVKPKHNKEAATAQSTKSSTQHHSSESSTNESSHDDLDADVTPTQKKALIVSAKHNSLETTEPRTYKEAMRSPDAPEWKVAIDEEYQSLKLNDTWTVVRLPSGRKALSSKWVLKRKYGPAGEVKRFKARLCARGDQQKEGIDFKETYSAVVKASSYKVLFALQAIFGNLCHQMDVVTAFLNGKLEEEVYIRSPEGFPEAEGMVLRLQRALYGLKQSPRVWYGKFTKAMKLLGWRASSYDSCVFINDKLGTYMAIWVDDLLIFGKDIGAIQGIKQSLSKTFRMTDEGECSFYLGMHVHNNNGDVTLHQEAYTHQVTSRFALTHQPSSSVPADADHKMVARTEGQAAPDFHSLYQQKVGSLMWLSTVSRPDIAHATAIAARFNANPSQEHMDHVNQIFAYLKRKPTLGLKYRAGTKPELIGYVDSDHAGCLDTRRSTTGYIFLLGGSPVSWCSQRQKTVSTSTPQAEYTAAAEAAKEAIWLRNFINDLGMPGLYIDRVKLYIDNNAALASTKNPDYNGKMKHIDVKYHFIRELVEEGIIEPLRVPTKENIADILTKPLEKGTFEYLVALMGLNEGPSQATGGVFGRS